MPVTTWRVARREIARPLGLVEFSTTTNIGAGATIISTELQGRFAQPDFFNGWYATPVLDVDGGTPANGLATTVRRIKDYAEATGTLTAATPNFSAEDEAVDVDLYRFHPVDILRAYNRARQNVWPQVALIRDIETIVTGPRQLTYTVPSTIRDILNISLGQRYEAGSTPENLFLNAGFENWTSATSPDNWTVSSVTANQEVATTSAPNYAVLSGSNSARIVVSLNTAGNILQTVDSASSDYPAVAMEGMEVNVSAWVHCTTTGRISTRIAGVDGSTHTGTGWELLKQSATLGATATSVAAGLAATSGAAMPFFVDEINLTVGPTEILELPYIQITNWEHVPPVNGASDGGIIRFSEQLPDKHRIRIVGTDLVSSVSVDTDTIEVDGELLEPLYNKTRQFLCEERAQQSANTDQIDRWTQRARGFEDAYLDAINMGVGVDLPVRVLKQPDRAF